MRIVIKRLSPEASIPQYAHGPAEDAGMDLRATERVVLEPNVPQAVSTGISIEVPPGFEAQVRPRSGLALKHALTLPNSPATIDPGYRGEVRVIMLNLGKEAYTVHPGDRIAQIVIARYEAVEWEEGELSETVRGAGGFGSSGR
jgi:dUTP pyrophosphatase